MTINPGLLDANHIEVWCYYLDRQGEDPTTIARANGGVFFCTTCGSRVHNRMGGDGDLMNSAAHGDIALRMQEETGMYPLHRVDLHEPCQWTDGCSFKAAGYLLSQERAWLRTCIPCWGRDNHAT